jgi:hypothetical protein
MAYHIDVSIKGFGTVADFLWALKTLVSNFLVHGNHPRLEKFGYKDLHVRMKLTESPMLPKTGENSKQ